MSFICSAVKPKTAPRDLLIDGDVVGLPKVGVSGRGYTAKTPLSTCMMCSPHAGRLGDTAAVVNSTSSFYSGDQATGSSLTEAGFVYHILYKQSMLCNKDQSKAIKINVTFTFIVYEGKKGRLDPSRIKKSTQHAPHRRKAGQTNIV